MKTLQVVAAIILNDGRILATQRGYGEFEGGWEFPGGKIEPGETGEQALVREIREELAASICVERHIVDVDYDYPTFHLHMQCFLCRLEGESLTLLEHEDARWLDAASIESVKWLPADIEVVRAIQQQAILSPAEQ